MFSGSDFSSVALIGLVVLAHLTTWINFYEPSAEFISHYLAGYVLHELLYSAYSII